MIHLNTASVSQIDKKIVRELTRLIKNLSEDNFYLNHYPYWNKNYELTRNLGANLLRVNSEDIALISSSSEGLSSIINSLISAGKRSFVIQKDAFITSRLLLKSKKNIELIETNQLISKKKPDVILVEWVHHLTGNVTDIKALQSWCIKNDVILIIDAVQALGATPLNFKLSDNVALISGGHKWLGGLEGSGFMYVGKKFRKNIPSQVFGYRAALDIENSKEALKTARAFEIGTLSLVSFSSLALSLKMITNDRIKKINIEHARICRLIKANPDFRLITPENSIGKSGIISFQHRLLTPQQLASLFLSYGLIVKIKKNLLRISVNPKKSLNANQIQIFKHGGIKC